MKKNILYILCTVMILAGAALAVSAPVPSWAHTPVQSLQPGYFGITDGDANPDGVAYLDQVGGLTADDYRRLADSGKYNADIPRWIAEGKLPADYQAPGGSASTPAANAQSSGNAASSQSQTAAKPKEPEITVSPVSGNYVPKEEVTVYGEMNGSEEIGKLEPWKVVAITGETSTGLFQFKYNDDDEAYADKNVFVTQTEYDEAWEVTEDREATCTEEGITVKTNSLSGETQEETKPMIEHDYRVAETVEPGCETNGKVVYECSVCGDSYEDITDPLGHDDGEWVVAKEAGAFSEGLRELRCTRDGFVLSSEVIPQTFPLPLWAVILIIAGAGAVVVIVVLCVAKKKKSGK